MATVQRKEKRGSPICHYKVTFYQTLPVKTHIMLMRGTDVLVRSGHLGSLPSSTTYVTLANNMHVSVASNMGLKLVLPHQMF